MPTVDEFRSELRAQLRVAELAGQNCIVINAGDLHRKVGGYPSPAPSMPSCCNVMRQERRPSDAVASAKSRDGALFAVRYQLPR